MGLASQSVSPVSVPLVYFKVQHQEWECVCVCGVCVCVCTCGLGQGMGLRVLLYPSSPGAKKWECACASCVCLVDLGEVHVRARACVKRVCVRVYVKGFVFVCACVKGVRVQEPFGNGRARQAHV